MQIRIETSQRLCCRMINNERECWWCWGWCWFVRVIVFLAGKIFDAHFDVGKTEWRGFSLHRKCFIFTASPCWCVVELVKMQKIATSKIDSQFRLNSLSRPTLLTETREKHTRFSPSHLLLLSLTIFWSDDEPGVCLVHRYRHTFVNNCSDCIHCLAKSALKLPSRQRITLHQVRTRRDSQVGVCVSIRTDKQHHGCCCRSPLT